MKYAAMVSDGEVVNVVVVSETDDMVSLSDQHQVDYVIDVTDTNPRPGIGWTLIGDTWAPPQPSMSHSWNGESWVSPASGY